MKSRGMVKTKKDQVLVTLDPFGNLGLTGIQVPATLELTYLAARTFSKAATAFPVRGRVVAF